MRIRGTAKALGWAAILLASPATLRSDTSPTRFELVSTNGVWWFQQPGGNRFVSLGVCCVDTGVGFQDFDPSNPGYAAYRYYPAKATWTSDVCSRLLSWHFNTVGAWSDPATTSNPQLLQTPILNLGAAAGAPWKDLWSPDVVQSMAKTAHDQIGRFGRTPNIIGYFSDNEMGWWEGALFDWVWKSDPQSGQRAHFVSVLRRRYPSWAAVTKDFIPAPAAGFDSLLTSGRLYLRPGGFGMRAVKDYVALLADRYYRVCRDAIKKEDPGSLYLGDRYISNFYPEVAAASKPFVDAVSTNLNASFNDGSFAHYYLPSLAEVTQKPILITEYYQAATENRSGDRNDSSGFPVSATQTARAAAVEVATKYLFAQPQVVGAHWFQYYDEPGKGRGDGEDYDMGLVDTANKPYEPLTQMFHSLDLNSVHTSGSPVPLDASSGIPAAPGSVGDLMTWNRTRGFVPPSSDSHRADLFACFSEDALYLALYWDEDRFAEAFYRNNEIPFEDFPQIHIRAGKDYIKVVVPPKGQIEVSADAILLKEIRGVRNQLILKIPVAGLGLGPLRTGQAVNLDVGLATRGRSYFGRWKGSFPIGQQP